MLYYSIFDGHGIYSEEKIKDGMAINAEIAIEEFQRDIKNCFIPQEVNLEKDDNSNLRALLLLKYVYYKIIVGDNAKAEKLLLLTTDNFVKTKFYNSKAHIVNFHVIIDDIIDSERNILIPDKDLEKCWQVLTLFNILKRKYSKTFGIPYEFSEIQNYDKFITKNFVNNITKIDPIIIPDSCENYAKYNPIILPSEKHFNNKLLDKNRPIKEYCEPYNIFSDANLVIDWLFQNCKHVETFEIGIFAATSQALYVTEGFDAFKKFITCVENLSDENRIEFVNVLIKFFNNFIREVYGENYFYIIPKIIMTLNMCDKILQYPVSVAESTLNATTMNPIFKDFMLKKYDLLIKVIYDFRNNPKNATKTQTFSREKTIPMRTIISEYNRANKKL